jgi:penicillin-binding protein 2
MLIFDQLKKDDPQLRFLAVVVACGLLVLLAGLWWVQVVSGNYYQDKLETQSIRTVRMPAVRGNILDRDGRVLAENRPSYNVDLYLEDLTRTFQSRYTNLVAQLRASLARQKAEAKKQIGHNLTRQEQKQLDRKFVVTEPMKMQLQEQARFDVSSNIVAELSARLGNPIPFEAKEFQKRYEKFRALPLPVMANLDAAKVCRFEEQSMHTPGMDLDIQSVRFYPNGPLAAHVLGYITHNSDSGEGEPSEYNYRLDDYLGISGIEHTMDKDLRGMAGGKSVLVNNLGYRQRETIWAPVEPGKNVVLTIDRDIQKQAEAALAEAQANTRGAVIVMDAQNGDILAMASAPTFNPNIYAERHDALFWAEQRDYLEDTNARPQINRAMQENYAPGSIFKIVTGMAGLENGTLHPEEIFHSEGYFPMPGLAHPIGDTAKAGDFDFDRALAKSSNPYFITNGLKPGVLPRIIALGQRLHLGERTGLIHGQEASGHLPTPRDIASSSWYRVETAYLSIGQGQIAVTPLQMAVMVAAVANGGKVLQPRLVARVEPYGAVEPETQLRGPAQVRDSLGVSQRTLQIVRHAMRKDVESPEGTGHDTDIPGFAIAGKTGTAEVEKHGHKDSEFKDTWFVSFAPFDNPRYVVLAMVEGGRSGGHTCVPIVHKVYQAILQREHQREQKPKKLGTLAEIR